MQILHVLNYHVPTFITLSLAAVLFQAYNFDKYSATLTNSTWSSVLRFQNVIFCPKKLLNTVCNSALQISSPFVFSAKSACMHMYIIIYCQVLPRVVYKYDTIPQAQHTATVVIYSIICIKYTCCGVLMNRCINC